MKSAHAQMGPSPMVKESIRPLLACHNVFTPDMRAAFAAQLKLTRLEGYSTKPASGCKKNLRKPPKGSTVPNDVKDTAAFQEYQKLLWRVFAVLARRGYDVAPDEARDVLHDFYVEAWPGALGRFDRTKGSLEGYLAGAFYRFARRKCVENIRWHRSLVSAELLEVWPSHHPGPAEIHEEKERRQKFESALRHLTLSEREAVAAYLNEDVASERAIAQSLGITRHEVRRRLASAVQRLSDLVHQAPRVATSLARDDYATTKLKSWSAHKEDAQMDKKETQTLLARLLASGKPRIALTSDARARLRHALINDDVELAPNQVRLLHENPEALAEFYESLFPIQDVAGPESQEQLARAISEAAQEEDARLEEAFEVLFLGLPEELQADCERCFYDVDRETLQWALSFTSIFKRNGDKRADLRTLLPTVTAGAMRGLVLLFDDALAEASDADMSAETRSAERRHSRDVFVVRSEGTQANVARELVRSQLEATPNLPPEAASKFAGWVLEVISACPTFVRGYELVATQPWTFERTPWLSDYDLVNLWDSTKRRSQR